MPLARKITAFDFAKAFDDVVACGKGERSPFAWQSRLFDLLKKGEIPDSLDIPTGLGKTSVISLWLLARAAGAHLPRRLIYVVDRRTVVDQATEYATKLQERLKAPECEYLRKALSLEDRPLSISTLRGKFADNRAWLSDIAGPAIVIGTVDMIGSRILFRGYGVASKMRPIQAGLLAVDSFLILDEAHLSQPFLHMVKSVSDFVGSNNFRVMSLSATQSIIGNVFKLTPKELNDDLVRKRIEAEKILTISELPKSRIVNTFCKKAISLASVYPGARILVFCNSFDYAGDIGDKLTREVKKSGIKVKLLTGQQRGRERDNLKDELEELGFLAEVGTPREHSVILIATSAGEVGIDLDADHMLCDLVSWERMVQRLGRVNRRGEGKATVTVWDIEREPKGSEGERKRRNCTRALLNLLPLYKKLSSDTVRRQAGPAALSKIAKENPIDVAKASTPPPIYPPLTLPIIEAWSMTSLPDHEGRPEVGPWLRGWETQEPPQSKLVWRRYLPGRRIDNKFNVTPAEIEKYLSVAPLRPSEILESDSHRVLEWMKFRANSLIMLRNSHEQAHLLPPKQEVAALILQADGTFEHLLTFEDWEANEPLTWDKIKELLPSRTLVLRREVSGLSKHGLLSSKEDEIQLTGDINHTIFQDMIVEFKGWETEEEYLNFINKSRCLGVFATEQNRGGEEKQGFAVFRLEGFESEDEDARAIGQTEKTLAKHTAEVVSEVKNLSTRLGLPPNLCEALCLAAQYHDIGKAATIWQQAAGATPGEIMAKTTGRGVNWKRLNGYRHEFGSLVELEQDHRLPEETRNLILHLVAAHHGYARPLIAPDGCIAAPSTQLYETAGQAALRFAALSREHGPWGLAWLEAILRTADQRASATTEGKTTNG